jgi:hypothetical protein
MYEMILFFVTRDGMQWLCKRGARIYANVPKGGRNPLNQVVKPDSYAKSSGKLTLLRLVALLDPLPVF